MLKRIEDFLITIIIKFLALFSAFFISGFKILKEEIYILKNGGN